MVKGCKRCHLSNQIRGGGFQKKTQRIGLASLTTSRWLHFKASPILLRQSYVVYLDVVEEEHVGLVVAVQELEVDPDRRLARQDLLEFRYLCVGERERVRGRERGREGLERGRKRERKGRD